MLNLENILTATNNGLLLYFYVILERYPRKEVISLFRKGLPLPNPFIPGGKLQLRLHEGIYEHEDLLFSEFKGNAIDFAGLHFRSATLHELYYMINQTLKLGLRIPSEELLEQVLKAEAQESLACFSFFEPPIGNTSPLESLNVPQLYRRITGPCYVKVTDTLRALKDPKEARQYKATHFPYVTFGGIFEKRKEQQLKKASGLIVIDLDDVEELPAVRAELLAQDEYETELLFVSPSGTGLKWVTSYAHLKVGHQDQFQNLCSYLKAVFQLDPDVSGRDTSRACYICSDPDAVLGRKYLFP